VGAAEDTNGLVEGLSVGSRVGSFVGTMVGCKVGLVEVAGNSDGSVSHSEITKSL